MQLVFGRCSLEHLCIRHLFTSADQNLPALRLCIGILAGCSSANFMGLLGRTVQAGEGGILGIRVLQLQHIVISCIEETAFLYPLPFPINGP